jgi:1-deoxy-D-xylulose-5-phosphate synthase
VLLDKVNLPDDIKSFNVAELTQLAQELVDFVKNSTQTKAGHIKSSIAVAELTVALHYIFHTPSDILIWDVGHQAYIHKVLTGRKANFFTNRKKGGLAGFTNSSESEYDPFGAGHSSTSISAAAGFAMAAKLSGKQRKHIAVIGDGAFTGGMSFEALNFLGEQQLDVLVILNDNDSSIDKNVGALAAKGNYEDYCKSVGVNYLGEVDGHNMDDLLQALKAAADSDEPRLIRVKTKKKDLAPALSLQKDTDKKKAYQDVFAEAMIELATSNSRIVAITPAMLSGSGLNKFKQHFADRTFDVGIAEQHAVTMAAGLAADGYIPVVHLYSTFSQRAFDQIIHDVALQNLHVVFCLDRAGLVGEDGATHHGSFDVGFLNTIPNLTITAPMDGLALQSTLKAAVEGCGPWVIRYPKAEARFLSNTLKVKTGKARVVKQGAGKAVLSLGAIGFAVSEALVSTPFSHYDITYLKPIDKDFLLRIADDYSEVITVEENSARGGLGDTVRAFYADKKIDVLVRSITLPDRFIEHGTVAELHKACGLNPKAIRQFVNR